MQNAYHGTTVSAATRIITNGFERSTRDELYLGPGVYFYDGQLAKAKAIARNRIRNERGGEGAVVQSAVRLGNCLNLNDQAVVDCVVKFRRQYHEKTSVWLTDATVVDMIAQLAEVASN